MDARPDRQGEGSSLLALPPSRLLREVLEVVHQKEEPYVVGGSLFRERFSFEPTTLEEGIRRTIAWYESRRSASARAA